MFSIIKKRGIEIAAVVLIAGNLWFLHLAMQPVPIVVQEHYGSHKVANWYQHNKVSGVDVVASKSSGQLAAVGSMARSLMAGAGLVISPVETTIEIEPGLRREQIAELIGAKLNWTLAEQKRFARLETICYPKTFEGKYLPGTYTFSSYATPAEVEDIMQAEFRTRLAGMLNVSADTDPIVAAALQVASLLQREAAGDGDEKIIAGIIWNRIYADMNLQLDATLQYAKGQPGDWWPMVFSEDKYIDSPYNTYLNPGLPPTPIANPSLVMIEAALNPEPTECFYYIHANREFYCSKDYKEHKLNIRRYL